MTSVSVPGLLLRFYSNDHLPQHFHAEKPGEWEVRVFFLRPVDAMVEIKWGKPHARVVRALCGEAEGNRMRLLAEWEQKVLVNGPGSTEVP